MKKTALTAVLLGVFVHLPRLCFAQTESVPDSGVTAWMLTSTALVLLMIPGLALFYGGLVRTKNVLGTMMHSFAAMAIVGVLWAVCGYALSFGPNTLGGWIGWDPNLLFLNGLDDAVADGGIPEYVFAMFQGKFAIITPALIAGAFAERVKFKSYCLFIVLWVLLVYCPLCHWVWMEEGFLFNMGANGAIDFAGGTVVHISSGISALVIALYIGARRGYPRSAMHPNNLVLTLLGAGLLWVGWFGFNAGSSVSSGLDTARALTATQVAGASGALMWMIIEGLRHGKVTSLGLASGILAGLVVITPAAGVVKVPGAIMLGFIASVVSYFAIQLKTKFGYDDTLDVFGIHGVAGIVGAIGLTFFIRDEWMREAVAASPDGVWGVGQQLGVQLAATGITIVYAVVVTFIITLVIDKLCGFRVTERSEMSGLDQACHGEHGYGLLNLN
ncbi:MAG: ammonium transporter [Candidatus Omnitrophica bacterium]|nr:ammonium transporter [Candidatus Omnitrophota bacterium]